MQKSYFGIKKNKFSKNFLNIYKKCNFKYRELKNHEEQELIKFIINKITMDKRKTGSKTRKIVWQNGWNENYKLFLKNPKKLNALLPQYNNDNIYLRFFLENL